MSWCSQLGDYDVPFCEAQYMHGSQILNIYSVVTL